MKVENFKVKNQFKIEEFRDNKEYITLQSYESIVVEVIKEYGRVQKITLGGDWDYSQTTAKYVYLFLEEEGSISLYNIKNKKAYIEKLIKENKILIA